MQASTLQSSYGRGSVQDIPRHQLPVGSVWKLTDMIPNRDGAPVAKRGGWGGLGFLPGDASSLVTGVAWAPFPSGPQVISIDDNGEMFGDLIGWGPVTIPLSRPVYFQDILILPGSPTMKFDGANVPTPLVNAPDNSYWAATYKSRLVLGAGNTLYFSGVLSPESYDSLSFVNVTNPITGIAAMSNMIAVFSAGGVERLRGTTPPSSTSAGDFVLEPMFPEGCIDARSIVVYSGQVIWANENGVHISDGSAIQNLIELGGLQEYWTALMQDYDPLTWTVAGGYYAGHYVISIMDGTTFIDALACNLASKTWFFLGNLPVRMFAESYSVAPELYMAIVSPGSPQVGTFSPCFDPTSDNAFDANGVPVQPSIEYPYFRGSAVQSRWRDLFLGVDLDTDDGAYLAFSYVDMPAGTDYELVYDDFSGPITVAGTDGLQNQRIPLHLSSPGFGLKVQQVGGSNHTRLYDLEAEVREREGRR